jgi:serine O-acetyltransferase
MKSEKSSGTETIELKPGEPVEVIRKIVGGLLPQYCTSGRDAPNSVMGSYPNPKRIIDAHKILIDALVPGKMSPGIVHGDELDIFLTRMLSEAWDVLIHEIERALPFAWIGECARVEGCQKLKDPKARAHCIMANFYAKLPMIRAMITEDTRAAYDGDPAALSYAEVQLGYPGLLAITSHRLAHELYLLDVPVVPRVMSEWIHTKTGIDIHPGAKIGHGFFIDHGTGVVIGETSVIGNRVKIYQGVTLGAKSFPLDENGLPIKHIKRHPTVEDDVVIYSNAAILGGDVRIGKGTTIGGNVFLMESVPENSFVAAIHPELHIKQNSNGTPKA